MNRWLAAVGVVAAVGVGLAAYALTEADDGPKPDERPLRTLRVDLRALDSELKARMAGVEKTSGDALGQLERLSDTVERLEQRLEKLEEDDRGDRLSSRIDDLEQRLEQLEERPAKSN